MTEQGERSPQVLRVATWNVNGLRAVLKTVGNVKGLLERLDADVVCLQETKLRGQELCRELAIVEGWDSFFSCAQSVRGYAGVATFTRTRRALPQSAEAGFAACTAAATLAEAFSPEELAELDSEGRVLATDLGAFVLFNLYGPAITQAETADVRMTFKMRYFKALQIWWEELLGQGRRVVVVGDLNICPAPIDQPEAGADFYRTSRPDRLWLRSLLHGGGGAGGGGAWTDVFRALHPGRRGAFTCWSTATAARVNNYGSRIDLVLSAGLGSPLHPTPGLPTGGLRSQPCTITACDISPHVHGSDHCPVWLEVQSSGAFPCAAAAPPSSTRYTFAGKQLKLHAWLQQPGARTTAVDDGGRPTCRPEPEAGPAVAEAAAEDSGPAMPQQHRQLPPSAAASKKQGSLRGFVQRGSSSGAAERPVDKSSSAARASGTLDVHAELAAAQSLREDGNAAAKQAWGRIQQRMAAPNCSHGEQAVLKQVNKSGPNNKRYFYCCARPQGPAPHGKCPYFVWVEKRKAEGSGGGAAAARKRTKT